MRKANLLTMGLCIAIVVLVVVWFCVFSWNAVSVSERMLNISANLYGFYSIAGIDEQKMNAIRDSLDDIEKAERFRQYWSMSESEFYWFCRRNDEYSLLEIQITLCNESDALLYPSIVCALPDSFIGENAFLYRGSANLPEHARCESESAAYILLKTEDIEASADLMIYCESTPKGIHSEEKIRTRLISEWEFLRADGASSV